MPTKEGWPTIDEEQAMRSRAKARRRGEDAPVEDLPMSVTLSIGEWQQLLARGDEATEKVRKMLDAHLAMAQDIR